MKSERNRTIRGLYAGRHASRLKGIVSPCSLRDFGRALKGELRVRCMGQKAVTSKMAFRTHYSRPNGEEPKAAAVKSDSRAPRTILQSWKEIAVELHCGVRTAQRWEKELGMPVRRLGKGPKAHVFAFTDELRHWLANARSHKADGVLLHSMETFFQARQSANVIQTCNQCGSSTKFLNGQFWVYETTMKWSLAIPFCPICDAAVIQGFCRSQIIQ
jgi:hypothetical protein